MGSLTSQLIVSLLDRVSHPAKEMVGALKSVTDAEKKLAAAGNAKGVDGLATSMRKAATAAKALGTGTASWSSSFDSQLGKLNLTEKQINRLRSAFERFQNTLKSGGMRKAADFLPQLDQWERRTIGSLHRVTRAYGDHRRRVDRMADIRHGAHHLIYPVASGYALARGGEKAIEKTAELGREKVREDLSGMNPNERVAAMAQARDLSNRYKSIDQVEILSHLRKLRGTLGDLHHAQEMVEDVVRAQVVMSSGPGGASGAVTDLDQITKGLEGAGYASTPDKFRRMLTAFVKGKNLFGETLTGGDFRTYIQRAKVSKYGLDESYLAGVVPTMIQHEGATQFGTAQATAFSSLVGGRQTKAAKAKLRKFGLLDKDNNLVDRETFVTDPYEWAIKNVVPRTEAAGMSIDANSTKEQRDKYIDFLMTGFSHRNTGEFLTSLIANRKVIEKDRANLKSARGLEAAPDVIKNDPFQAWESLKSQSTNMVQNLLESSSLIQGGLSTIADTIGNLAKRFSELSPDTKKLVANAVEGATVAGGGFLSYLVGKKGFDWLRGGKGTGGAGAIEKAIGEAAGTGGKAAGKVGTLARVAPWLAPLLGTIQPDVGTDPAFTEHLRRKFEGAERPEAQQKPDQPQAPLWKRLLIGDAADKDFSVRDRLRPHVQPDRYQRDFTLGYGGGFSKDPSVVPPSNLKTMTKWSADRVAPGDLSRTPSIMTNLSRLADTSGRQSAEAFSQSMMDGLPKAWPPGADPAQFLDQSGPAGSAGAKTAEAFKSNFETELHAVDQVIQHAMQRWGAMLGSFRASPSITPSISTPTGGSPGNGGGQKLGSLETLSAKQQTAQADYGFRTV
jgi:hypothetical protein